MMERGVMNICKGCLSVDSCGATPGHSMDLYNQLISNQKINNNVDNVQLSLCLYCRATLRKMWDFKKRCIETAQTLTTLLAMGEINLDDLEKACKTKWLKIYNQIHIFNITCCQNDQIISDKSKTQNKHSKKKKIKSIDESLTNNLKANSNVLFINESDLSTRDVIDASPGDIDAGSLKHSTSSVTGVDEVMNIEEDCDIKAEIRDFSDGFDSEDDQVLTKLEINTKSISKNGISNDKKNVHRTAKKRRKKKKIKLEVAEEPSGRNSGTIDGADIKIKEELDDAVIWEEGVEQRDAKKKVVKKERILNRKSRLIYYRFDESNVQLIKQTVEEIQNELQTARGATGYVSAPYMCHPCAKYFMTDISLTLHNQRHCETAGPMVCEICTQRYTNHRSLSIHMQTHTDRYKCTYVGPDTAKTSNIGGNVTSNEVDSQNGGGQQEISNNVDDESDIVCDRVFAARSAAVKHALKHTGDQMLFRCDICSKTTNCANTHQKHVRSHTVMKKYTCPQCNKEFKNSTTRNLHVMRAHTGVRHFSCPSCSMTFVNKTALVAHSVKHSTDREFYCVECDMYFKSASILKCHLTTSVKHSDPNTFKFQCSMCPRRYPLLYRLRDHVESAHARRGHCVCDVCGATYHTTAALRRHHRQKHENTPRERKHRCLVCDKAFLTRQTLASHQLTHTGERPFPCQHCGRLFRHKAALWTHNKLVHNKNKPQEVDAQ